MTLWFPDSIEKENTESLLTRAIDFDDLEEAEKLFEMLEKQPEPDLQTLYHGAKELKKYEKAIFYKQKELESATDARDKASSILDITALHILNNDYIKAFESEQSWERLLTEFDSWQYTGLGRMMSDYLNVLKKALACSKAVRDKKGIRLYKKLVKREQKNIDEMFKNR
ncbi:hypothetical protein ABU162_17125 [Paenibacillus thiaminolyticus]|uniref:hypothetical protein n=1 Tax=Paenibacillus thiaminolyticus TaxID=49283 RepID=UPI0035A6FF0D